MVGQDRIDNLHRFAVFFCEIAADLRQSKGTFGWAGAYGTIYRINPHERLVIMLMVQLLPNTTDIREKFPLMVYQALDGSPRLHP